ncbi:serine palmitoyltransferase 1-like [Homalodisca vitripennis]|uniref:serine palmitoyltransferase 1-like n=1 Tax=Homalodisca vitripennis TaxID=197043 RepID=UPI001EEC1E18|nr:serine palmitoyltransferase 1-like [Homalodisca vitripennis]
MVSIRDFVSFLGNAHNGQITLIALEVTLLLGVIWLIFKKNKSNHRSVLTEDEEEELINAYRPESLTGDVPATHPALRPRVVTGKIGVYVELEGVRCLNFSTHDYLGFVGDDRIEAETTKCIGTYGVGACGPRGFYGTTLEHLELERSLAEFTGLADALVYAYGFATAASAIPAYAKKDDIIFVDEKRNFAIQRGLDASKSTVKFFKHNDTKDLEAILDKVKEEDLKDPRRARRSRRYLIAEGIYINTGEICPLPGLVRLCKKHKVRIVIDESISFGVLGKTGRGVSEYYGVPREDVDLIIGSLEYVLGSVGGFCVGSRFLVDHQQASGLGYCFSASLPPLLATAALEGLRTIQREPGRLTRLRESCHSLHSRLQLSAVINNHFDVSGDPDSPVKLLTLPDHTPDPETTLERILEFCMSKRVAVTHAAFLPVDSAMVTPSLRITVSVLHSQDHIAYLVLVLEDACRHVFFHCYTAQ